KKLVPVLILVSLAILYLPVFGCHSSGSKAKDADTSVQKEAEKPDGFVSIFDGKTLDGWKGDTSYWHVKDGVIVGQETEATAPLLKANTFLIWEGGQPSN